MMERAMVLSSDTYRSIRFIESARPSTQRFVGHDRKTKRSLQSGLPSLAKSNFSKEFALRIAHIRFNRFTKSPITRTITEGPDDNRKKMCIGVFIHEK